MTDLPSRSKRKRAGPPPGFGEVLTRLPEPQNAGDLTVAEVTEVRARDEEAITVTRKLEAARAELQHLTRVQHMLKTERALFIRGLCRSRRLPDGDEFNVDLDRGILLRVATKVPMAAVPSNGESQPEGEAG